MRFKIKLETNFNLTLSTAATKRVIPGMHIPLESAIWES